MGTIFSNPLTNTPNDFPVFAIDFSRRHALSVMLGDCRVVDTVSSAVLKMWTCGVERESRVGPRLYEIRFFEALFDAPQSYQVCCLLFKRVMCRILMDLYQTGA